MSTIKNSTAQDVDVAMEKAAEAFKVYRKKSGKEKAVFLRAIADEIEKLGDELIKCCSRETNLPEARITGERNRTTGQLRMFASLVEEGSWVEARIDTAQPDRQPLPKPDIRKMNVAIGPVVVFGASNFPLAFSTAGGDTASALAAGCTVVVKAHSGHPQTSELITSAVLKAAKATGMPDGVFANLHGSGSEVGSALVKHPHTRAVGFTGSFKGGMALFDLANKRPHPIPVFAEMGSINPVFILPGALKKRAEQVAEMYAASITQGVGQFCTNPGLLLTVDTPESEKFKSKLGELIRSSASAKMLHPGIASAFAEGRKTALQQKGVELVAEASQHNDELEGRPTLASVTLDEFVANPKLAEEVFGPYSLLVKGEGIDKLDRALDNLEGQLTATVIGEEDELPQYAAFIERLKEKVGRVIINGVPTGVEVCHSMNHGGPFPATTDSRFTSVGTDAIKRFVRPVSYQGFPESLLPDELKTSNPLKIWRIVDGKMER